MNYNARWFFEQFTSRVTEAKYETMYKMHEAEFTPCVTKEINSIIRDMGLTSQNEYYRIDAIGWKGRYRELSEEKAKKLNLSRHLWDLEIAVEHENSKSDWTDELVKLTHICCPLKVIITYNHCDQRGEVEKNKLAYAAECMKKVRAFNSLPQEKYLIIIGNGAPQNSRNESYNAFDYRGYIYNYDAEGFWEICSVAE